MDVAALSMSVDSSGVVKATADLDKFAASADKAAASAGKLSGTGTTAKLGQDYARAAQAADKASGSIMRIADSVVRSSSAMSAATSASSAMRAANDNTARSFQQADAHVQAYTKHVQSMGAALQQADAHVKAWRTSLATANMTTQQADAHVLAYRNQLRVAGEATGAMRANTANLAAQFQDVGITAAMGMNPLLIALQQGTQLSAVLATTGGGALSTIKAAFASVLSPASLLTIALVAGAAALLQWGINALKASDDADKLSDAIKDTQITTYALSDAQTALGNVFDLTTGKIKTQSEALRGLARAQLEVIRATAIRDRAAASQTIAEQRGRNTPTISTAGGAGVMGMSVSNLTGRTSANDSQRLIDQFTSGKLTSTQAIDGMERLRKAGKLTEEQFIKLTGAVASFGMAGENLKVYEDARKALEGDQGALKQFLDPPSSRTRRGGKTDADRLADLIRNAKEAITAEENRAKATSVSAEAAAELEQKTKLLNAAASAGLKVTPALAKKIDELAAAYAKAKTDADVSEVVKGVTDDIDKQRDALADEIKLIGLRGDAYARAKREIDAQRKIADSLPNGAIAPVGGNLTGDLSSDIENRDRLDRIAKMRQASEDAAYAMDLERAGLELTGQAALEYAYIVDRLNEAKRAGIELSAAEIAAIYDAADAYAAQRYALDRQAQAIADTREVARGFFSDAVAGLRQTGSAFKAFADAAVNALNRVIDKLLDRTLNSFLDSLFPSSGAKVQAASLATIAANPSIFAKGGAFGTPQRFANGGAFTNQIFTQPTLFKFANGSKFGEMGEAGPEAVMPLTRGPDGKLGVQSTGGGGKNVIRMGDYNPTYQFEGAVGIDSIVALIRQGGAETYNQMKRDLQSLLQQLDIDGTVVT